MCASVLQVSNPDVIMSSSRRSASPPSATAKPCPTCKGTGVLNESRTNLAIREGAKKQMSHSFCFSR